MEKFAVIDCGTNTFNLLIAESSGSGFNIIEIDKYPVKIGKSGIIDKMIQSDAYSKAIEAMKIYAQKIRNHGVINVKALSTSAFRSTNNGVELKNEIFNITGIDVEIISGDEEAQYIYEGVIWAYPPVENECYLIMDIGGGSTEFIIYNKYDVLFKKSYDLGASRLVEMFSPSDPIHKETINHIEFFLNQTLKNELFNEIQKYKPKYLVGSSGFFDTLRDVVYHQFYVGNENYQRAFNQEIKLEEFKYWYPKFLHSTLEERLKVKGMVEFRADMMVLAFILVNFIVENSSIATIVNTKYALKEGALKELINESF